MLRTNTLGQIVADEPQSSGSVAQEGGVLEQIYAHWDSFPQWKKQAVVAGATSAITFFWFTRLNKFLFG